MTNTEIELSEGSASPATEVLVQPPQAGGWMAWYRISPQVSWSVVYSFNSETNRDNYRCPYPLIPSKEEAIEAGKRCFHGSGGELKLVRIAL